MNTIALCCQSFRQSVQKAAGVRPVLFPPTTVKTVNLVALSVADFVYVKLHGLADQPYWYGDDWITAVSGDQLKKLDLTGKTFFVANCFLPDSPMLEILLNRGVRCVVAGEGENYAGQKSIIGADLLGYDFRRMCQMRVPPLLAYRTAMARLKTRPETNATLDTLEFKFYKGRKKL